MSDTFAAPTPHGPILPVVDGVRAVRGTFRMGPGLVISRTMTLVDVGADGVAVINSVRLLPEAEAALGRRVTDVVKLSDAHGLDDPYYVKTFGAAYWALAGATLKRLPRDRTLGPESPIPGARVLSLPTAAGCEGALWLPHGGGTVITCDAVQNHVDTDGASWFARVMTPILGFKGGVIVPKMWRKTHRVKVASEALAALRAERFENLVTAHGPPVIGGADALVRAAIERVG